MSKEIPLTQGKVALVDDEDYEWLTQWKWHYSARGYAVRSCREPKPQSVRMHRVIVGAEPSEEVDHINGDKLDNRRCNLRKCTHAENMRNMKFRDGVSHKGIKRHKSKWAAQITVNGKHIYLGLFNTEVEAAKAYDAAAREHFAEFAKTNFHQA